MRLGDGFYTLSRWGLGGLMVWAGIIKLREPAVFAVLIDAFGLVPESLLLPLAVVLPIVEVMAGLALIFDIQGSLAMIAGLLLLFVIVLGWGIRMGLDIDCGCFGPQDPEVRAFHGLRASLYRDLALLAVVGFIHGWRRYRDIRPAKLLPLLTKGRVRSRHEDDSPTNLRRLFR